VFINHWRHYRHDLLNQIQLVKSYLQLGRMEDVKRSIDQIVVQAKQHSLLSKLSDPELAYDLLTYNYQSAPFYLDVEMTLTYDELDEIADEHNWLDMVKELLDLMEKGSKFMPDRPLPHFSLIFGREEKDLCRFSRGLGYGFRSANYATTEGKSIPGTGQTSGIHAPP
jgi:hypothetical protein